MPHSNSKLGRLETQHLEVRVALILCIQKLTKFYVFFLFTGIQDYFLHHLACDELPSTNYRSLIEGQNYLRSGWVGRIVHRMADAGLIVFKGLVRFSQTINSYHTVEATLRREDARVMIAKCDCTANQGKCCSHMAGLLYKIHWAAMNGYTGIACTDISCAWNNSTSQNDLRQTLYRTLGHPTTSLTFPHLFQRQCLKLTMI